MSTTSSTLAFVSFNFFWVSVGSVELKHLVRTNCEFKIFYTYIFPSDADADAPVVDSLSNSILHMRLQPHESKILLECYDVANFAIYLVLELHMLILILFDLLCVCLFLAQNIYI